MCVVLYGLPVFVSVLLMLCTYLLSVYMLFFSEFFVGIYRDYVYFCEEKKGEVGG